jgi:hypothetical protein
VNEETEGQSVEDRPSLDLTRPATVEALDPPWTLVAHNKRVLQSWNVLCENTRENASRCYQWLSQHATTPIPRRCYPLKGSAYAGCWAFEIGSGDRVYYKPDESAKRAVIYYAGPHPRKAPEPPA